MSLDVAATVFALLLPAELPDKTALASLILGSRYRPGFVFAGVAALALHVAFAVAVGCLLALLPHRRWRWWSPSCSWPVHCCSCGDEGATGMTTSV